MLRVLATDNVHFLCSYLFSKEKFLLTRAQLELISSAKSKAEFFSTLTGTVFHHLFHESFGDAVDLQKVEEKAGEDIREFYGIEPELVFLSTLEKVIEAFKLLALTKEKESLSERTFLCGFKGRELLNPERYSFKSEEIWEYLVNIKSSISAVSDPLIIDLELNSLQKELKFVICKKYGDSICRFVKETELLRDIMYAVYLLKYPQGNEMQEEHFLNHSDKDAIRAYLKAKASQSSYIFLEELLVDHPEMLRFVKPFFKAETVADLRKAFRKAMELKFEEECTDKLSKAYPLAYFYRYYRQLEILKKSFINLFGKNFKDDKEAES